MTSLLEKFRAARPELGPDAKPAIAEVPYGPVPDYHDELVLCRDCDIPLAVDEYDEDYDGDSEGFTFCGRDRCHTCQLDHEAELTAKRMASRQVDNGPAANRGRPLAASTGLASCSSDGAAGPASRGPRP